MIMMIMMIAILNAAHAPGQVWDQVASKSKVFAHVLYWLKQIKEATKTNSNIRCDEYHNQD